MAGCNTVEFEDTAALVVVDFEAVVDGFEVVDLVSVSLDVTGSFASMMKDGEPIYQMVSRLFHIIFLLPFSNAILGVKYESFR